MNVENAVEVPPLVLLFMILAGDESIN